MIPQSAKGIKQNSSQLFEVRLYTLFFVYPNFVLLFFFFFFHTPFSRFVGRGWKSKEEW